MNYEWTRSSSIRDKNRCTIRRKYLNNCLFKRRTALDRRNTNRVEEFSAEMRRYVLSLPLGLYHAQHGAGAYLGSQDAARPVRSFVWPSCNSTWNRKRRFLPCCPRTMRSREIPERTWARSNYEVFYQQRRSKIFISPAENLRIETSRPLVQAVLYLEFTSVNSYIAHDQKYIRKIGRLKPFATRF